MILLREAVFLLILCGGLASAALAARKWLGGAESWLAGGVLFLAENALAVIVLGFAGVLGPGPLLMTLAGFILGHLALWWLGARPMPRFPKPKRPKSLLLVFLGTIAGLWFALLITEAWVLPPRGWDSLSYHLTNPLFWLQQGRIALLPGWVLRENAGFAYPGNGEALYLLQLALTRSQRFLGLGPLVYIALSLFGLRSLSQKHGTLAFLLAFLTPVGLAQAALNYVDWAFFFWFTGALGFAHNYWKKGGRARLGLALVSVSALAGVKYSGMAFYGIFSVVLLMLAVRKRDTLAFLGFWIVGLGLFAPWYLRNWALLGNPVFDMAVGIGPWVLFEGRRAAYTYGYQYLHTLQQIVLFPLRDLGLGTYEGGAGPGFWFGGLPLSLWFLAKDALRRDWAWVFVWAQALVFLWLFTLIPGNIHPGEFRLVMPVLGVGFLGLARAWNEAQRPWIASWIVGAAVVFQAICPLQLQEHGVFPGALGDYLRGRKTSLFSYYSYQFPQRAKKWARLDGPGTVIRERDRFGLYAPLFGSRLQNRLELPRP